MEPKTTSNDTVPVSMDDAYVTVTQAWNNMLLPTPPDDFGNDQATFDYVSRLTAIIQELVEKANKYEYETQKLAEANVRQTKIIQGLRNELFRYKSVGLALHNLNESEGY